MRKQEFIVHSSSEKERIDKFLSVKLKDFTRSQIQQLCENNQVFVNGETVAKNYRLFVNDQITVLLLPEETLVKPEDLPLEICYQDEELAVINKPKGWLVYPTPHHPSGTLANALVHHFGEHLSNCGGEERPGIVHRLDRDTSGLLVIAKNNQIHQQLQNQIREQTMERYYQGVSFGELENSSGTIELPIGRDPSNPTRMAIVPDGREAKTGYQILQRYSGYTHLKFQLFTGRTHQIRVHMEAIGHPLVGDPVYSSRPAFSGLKGQCLHAYKLAFTHPVTQKRIEVESELPPYFQQILTKIS